MTEVTISTAEQHANAASAAANAADTLFNREDYTRAKVAREMAQGHALTAIALSLASQA